MSKVFIPHVPGRQDHVTNTTVPSLDLNPARQFGELVTLNGPRRLLTDEQVQDGISNIADGMLDFTDQDYILCVGDVALIATAIAYASDLGLEGPIKLLRWNRETKRYNVAEVTL